MDAPSGQSHPPGAPTPGRRDMMFCHACGDEWYRDEHGLTCPECTSDFTEIVSERCALPKQNYKAVVGQKAFSISNIYS